MWNEHPFYKNIHCSTGAILPSLQGQTNQADYFWISNLTQRIWCCSPDMIIDIEVTGLTYYRHWMSCEFNSWGPSAPQLWVLITGRCFKNHSQPVRIPPAATWTGTSVNWIWALTLKKKCYPGQSSIGITKSQILIFGLNMCIWDNLGVNQKKRKKKKYKSCYIMSAALTFSLALSHC